MHAKSVSYIADESNYLTCQTFDRLLEHMNGAENNVDQARDLVKNGSGVFKFVRNTDNVIVNEVRSLSNPRERPALMTFR